MVKIREDMTREQAEWNSIGIDTLNSYGGKGLNYLKIPKNVLHVNDDGMAKWNDVIALLEAKGYREKKWRWTKSGGLSAANQTLGFEIRAKAAWFEIVANTVGGWFRVTFSQTAKVEEEGNGMTGRKGFHTLRNELAKDGVSLDSYATEHGDAVKLLEIQKPRISFSGVPDEVYEHVHHLDLHSAYPSGVAKMFPEMAKTIQRIYDGRKEPGRGKELKLAMDAGIGFMQSEWCRINGRKYALANVAKAGVNWCANTIDSLARKLVKAGYEPLAFNTDGIWYRKAGGGPSEPFHCELEGSTLGTYANDHLDCKVRWKSKGAYEFIEGGAYKPVVRGYTRLDRIKPRERWEWGDIYRAPVLGYELRGRLIESVEVKEN